MALNELIDNDFKEALKSKDSEKLSVLRMLKSAIKNLEIENKKPLTDDEVLKLIQKEVKQRKDSIDSYTNAGRKELADKEISEIKYLEKYLPQQLTEQEIEAIVSETISEVKAQTSADIGKVMSAVMPKIAGKADGGAISSKARELLSN